MNANALARHYDKLTPEERAALILSAGARADEAEQDRILAVGKRITLTFRDHMPFAQAFDEIALVVFIELLDDAAGYLASLEWRRELDDVAGEENPTDDVACEEEASDAGDEDHERSHRLTFAFGYVLKTRAAAWQLFCERRRLPPFAVWERLPGFDRLQITLTLAEKIAFVPEGFLKWLNDKRPAGAPELTKAPLTVEGQADALENLFRDRMKWWGG